VWPAKSKGAIVAKRSVYVDDEMWERLAELADRNRRSVSNEARIAVEVYVGLVEAGQADVIAEVLASAETA
jgi:predicted transcriptional regulator